MELLSEEIRKNGFIYRLAKRGEKAMIYRQICTEEGDIVPGGEWYMQVFVKTPLGQWFTSIVKFPVFPNL